MSAPDDPLAPLRDTLYQRLHGLARRAMDSERCDHTLQPTALIHEVYLKLSPHDRAIADTEHYMAVAALQMRRVLVDCARSRLAKKRRPPGERLPMESHEQLSAGQWAAADGDTTSARVLAVHEALQALSGVSPRRARLVELRFFGGLGVDEAAEALGLSARTAARDWKVAQAFLRRFLAEQDDASGGTAAANR